MSEPININIPAYSDTTVLDIKNNKDLLTVPMADQSQVFAFAAAVVISRKLPVPSMPYQDGSFNYYKDNLKQEVLNKISAINEKFILDVKIAEMLTYSLWNARYASLHPMEMLNPNAQFDFFDALTGISDTVSPDQYQFADKYKVAILSLANSLISV